jgi:sugar phosphate isomerase/epimerase
VTIAVAGCNSQYARVPFEFFAAWQAKLGIKTTEFIAQVPHLWCDHLFCESTLALGETLRKNGLSVAAFTPRLYRYSVYADWGGEQRNATDRYFKNAMRAACELRAPLFCVENGGACFDMSGEALFERCADMLAELCDFAKPLGLNVAFGIACEGDSPILLRGEELKRLSDELSRENFRIILDTRTISVIGEKIEDWFEIFGRQIALVRFTDGNYNGCRVWGEGCLPCSFLMKKIILCGYGGVWSQYRRGESEAEAPDEADCRNIAYLRDAEEEICR